MSVYLPIESKKRVWDGVAREGKRVKTVSLSSLFQQTVAISDQHLTFGDEHFFALEDAARVIDKWLATHAYAQKKMVRAKTAQVMHSKLSFECKMAELGMILFFLESGHALPETENSLVTYWEIEMMAEVDRLKANHQANNKNEILSGRMHFLLSNFAHMVITTEQKLNAGGVHALILLLQTYSLSLHLKIEHTEHILKIAKQLINKPYLKNLLERKINIHHSLENIIRLDLNLSMDARVSSAFVMQACIKALFSDIRRLC